MWYKFTCKHGGGHQSYDEKYTFYDYELDAPTKEDEWNYWVHCKGWDNAIGAVDLIESLPPEIKEDKIKDYQDQIDYASTMIEKVKNETKI